jgi:hypothetical protein
MRNCDKVLETIDANIKMFEGYPTSAHNVATIESLKNQRQQIIDMQAGKMTYMEMDYSTREWFSEMPSWGTYGT